SKKVVNIDIPKSEDEDLSFNKSKVELIAKALEKHNGNRRLAAKEVGVSERTLYRQLKKYNLI
ncbi:MAG: helix-turn-helix domain-containing protein, partial [Bacteroidales bacterium]|nr:helix-turn-helix domain-containing protein [Bacteroidales bacterium]